MKYFVMFFVTLFAGVQVMVAGTPASMIVTPDYFGNEFSCGVYPIGSGQPVFAIAQGEVGQFIQGQELAFSFELEPGSYLFVAQDEYGDGFGFTHGAFALYVGGELLMERIDNWGGEEMLLFSVSSQVLSVLGCTDVTACNFDPLATIDDASCMYAGMLCDDADPTTVEDVLDQNCACLGHVVLGCMDATALNYNPEATMEDSNCLYILGCTTVGACNYDPTAEVDNGTCEYTSCAGCVDIWANNYDPDATLPDFWSCQYQEPSFLITQECLTVTITNTTGSSDGIGSLTLFDMGDGTILETDEDIFSYTYQEAGVYAVWLNYTQGMYFASEQHEVNLQTVTSSPELTFADGVLTTDFVADYYQWFVDDQLVATTQELQIYSVMLGTHYYVVASTYMCSAQSQTLTLASGCIDPIACNYDATAQVFDGSCEYTSCAGCSDVMAINYDPNATLYAPCFYFGLSMNWSTDCNTVVVSNFSGQVNEGGMFVYDMGDGTVISTVDTSPIVYAYANPGTYVITMMYAEGGWMGGGISGTITLSFVTGSPELTFADGVLTTDFVATSYDWYFEGFLYMTTTTPSIPVDALGDYHVVATVGNCASMSETFSLVSVAEEKNQSFSLYPNPATTHITVVGLTSISIYTIHGQLVFTERGPVVAIADLAPGVYVAVADSGATTRFIKE